ncbi:hypothetical protein ACMFMF_009959 [Clarireedia jacksonii]
MKKRSKVRPKNVVYLVLGSFLDCTRNVNSNKWFLEQFAVLLELLELLRISPSSRKVIQDPEFTSRDARFFAKHGFQTVEDPEGIEAIHSETLLFYAGGQNQLTLSVMGRPKPAMFIGDDVA